MRVKGKINKVCVCCGGEDWQRGRTIREHILLETYITLSGNFPAAGWSVMGVVPLNSMCGLMRQAAFQTPWGEMYFIRGDSVCDWRGLLTICAVVLQSTDQDTREYLTLLR